MPTLKLTTKFCESVAVECRTEFIDTMRRGLILRVSPQGRKDWSFRYVRSSDGRRQRLKIGSFPAVGLEVARKRALEHEASIASGADPASEAQQLKRADTVRELAGAYIEEYARPKKRTW
ncbi:MAG: Arm DNA-binding domain-containing protein, partial [Pseudomonadota bacterium]